MKLTTLPSVNNRQIECDLTRLQDQMKRIERTFVVLTEDFNRDLNRQAALQPLNMFSQLVEDTTAQQNTIIDL